MSMAPPSIKYLSMYLGSYEYMETTEEFNQEQDLPWRGEGLPWNGPTCLAVVCYVIKFCSNSNDCKLGRTIRHLNYLASQHYEAMSRWANSYVLSRSYSMTPEMIEEKYDRSISKIFVNSFMPDVEKFFVVPKPQELSHDKDNINSPNANELLESFINFLIQILDSEVYLNSQVGLECALLQKELTFLLSFLGDTPFRCKELEEVKNLLVEFETLANEVGSFIYSCVFYTRPVHVNFFIQSKDALLKLIELLNVKIEDHCINFPKFSTHVTLTTDETIDSLFIVDSLLNDLENLMNHPIELDIIMKGHMEILREKLTFSRSFTKDISMYDNMGFDGLKESLVQIRDVAYEAEYLINSHVVGNLPVWFLNLRLPDVVQKIKLVGTKLKGFIKIHDIKVMKRFSREVSPHAFGTTTSRLDNFVVDFDDERNRILQDLTGESRSRQIISIIGMPGVGKTTRARMLYNHGLIEGYFDKRAWCVVSQTYQKRNVLIDILASLSGKKDMDNNLKKEDEKLALEIHKILKKRRYLIVMDDVWCTRVWDDLNRYFPDDLNGSRIMFTSRIRDTTPIDSIFHTVSLLREEQSWSLLQEKVFPKEPCPPQLLGIGKKIAAKCGGLPLAVVVVAGILANLEKKESVWEKVGKNLDSAFIFDNDTNNCSKILELSYKHLPNYLKPCFLYFGAFPEDQKISIRKLTWLWIAEGFIQREEYKSPEQVAEEYLLDLINRSLLLIVERRNDGGIKACNIHDLLREMCQRIAFKENFLKSMQYDNFSMYEKHHRLCVHSTSPIYRRPFGLNCRSLFGHFSQPSFIFPQMKLLRVMDLLPVFDEFYELERIDLLVQLRYLAVDRMPKPLVDNLINLEVLCVERQDDEVIYIPSVLLRMVNLRHLRLKKEAKFEEYCENSHMKNLRSFSFVHINNNIDEEILKCSPNLLKLKCKCTNVTLFPDLTFLTSLESLKMVFNSEFIGELTEINFPSTIKELTLSRIGLPWGAISILGTLPNLHVLKLEYNSFRGYEWETSDGEFQELRILKLESINLVQWITCSEHFPKLQFLVVNMCLNLKNIPKELGDVSTLQKIEMINCEYWPCMSAVQIEREQRENGNEELQVIITTFLSWSKEELLLKCTEIEKEEHENQHEEFNASITCSDNLSEEEMTDHQYHQITQNEELRDDGNEDFFIIVVNFFGSFCSFTSNRSME